MDDPPERDETLEMPHVWPVEMISIDTIVQNNPETTGKRERERERCETDETK